MNYKGYNQTSGFALLLTLVVISVVLAIGLSLLNITVKQFTLSSTIRDSEVAFFAANTGIECVQYAVNQDRANFFSGNSVPVTCGNYGSHTPTPVSHSGNTVHEYQYQFSNAPDECVEVSTYTLNASGGDITYSFTGEGLDTGECSAGGQCTYLFSRGYNRACNNLNSLRVVQREIAVDF